MLKDTAMRKETARNAARTFPEPKGDKMADKKVERSHGGRPLTPTKRLQASLSDQGTVDMADRTHDAGRSALADKFREREERWRRDQAFRDREVGHEARETELEAGGATGETDDGGEGGAQ
jgi:hypothetical protein